MGLQISIKLVFMLFYLGIFLLALFFFFSGRHVDVGGNRMDGSWVSVCGRSRFVIEGRTFTHNTRGSGEFQIRQNRIIFLNCGSEYFITVRRSYMVINEVFYMLDPGR